MLKALGLKKPATEEQLQQYGEQKCTCERLQSDVNALRTAIDQLGTAYGSHKGDFALGRYDQLKKMIKEAVRQHKGVAERQGGGAGGGGEGTQGRPRGAIARLLQSAKGFAAQDQQPKPVPPNVANMTSKEMAAELQRLGRETQQLQRDRRYYSETLERLSTEYENSKKYPPPQRYLALKDMVKMATAAKPKTV